MDCRTTLLFALTLAAGGLGCTQMGQTTAGAKSAAPTATPPAPPKDPPPVITHKEPGPKRPPKAETCCAWAMCYEKQALESTVDPAHKQDLLEQARLGYQQALKTDPKCLNGYTGLARVYMAMNHYERAQETYLEGLQRHPKEGSLWYDLAICHCRTKQWELAIRSLQKALEIDPENRNALQTLGFCHARAGHIQDSLDTLSKIMSAAEAHYNVARMLHHMNQDDQCRQFLARALQLNPDFAAARTMLGHMNEAEGRPVLAGQPVPDQGVQIQFEANP
jgi:tetratricopeptide (TPR) repeat protein